MASLTLDWIQLAAAVGALQGLFLTGALAATRTNRTANRLLAALMAAFTVYLGSNVYYAVGLFPVWPHLFGVAYLGPWLFGPLVYLYAVAASDRSWRFRRIHLTHFALPLVVLIVALPFYLMTGAEKIAMYEQLRAGHDAPLRLRIVDPTKFISGIAYTVATVAYLQRHRRAIRDSYSNIARVNLNWLLWLSAGAAAVWALATAVNLTPVGKSIGDEYVSLGIALLVYAIGYMGLRQPEVFRFETSEFRAVKAAGMASSAAQVASTNPRATEPTERYEKSGLSQREAEELRVALVSIMETERPWKDSELTLADLATKLDTTPHRLSEVLNSQVRQTFYDFVNGYRVREVQRRIRAGDAEKLKMLALAMDAGFASKSTFNDVFKKHTNQTPSAYRQTAAATAGRGASGAAA